MRLLALVVIALPAFVAAAPCPQLALHASVLTPANATIAPGGGILVAAMADSTDKRGPADADIAARSMWRVRVADRTIAPGIRVLAPGLDVYDVGNIGGRIVLEDEDQKELVAVTLGKSPDLAAPRVHTLRLDDGSHFKHAFTSISAQLADKVPAGAVAVIAFGKDGARSWQRVAAGATDVFVYTSGGCSPLPNGTVQSQIGDEIALAWVDSSGRLSKKSAPVKITSKRP
jgi:hypothetical protein